jgi:nucleotide sugar dehydrogenase
MNVKVGFIGQGYIGKNYADDFENRGYNVVRYARSEPYNQNGDEIKDCDVVFIAVPTPTTPEGFDDSIIREVVRRVGKGKIAVIKSTILPGTTKSMQKERPNIIVLYSPEFLSETTAAHDAAHPFSNIVGMPVSDTAHKKAAAQVHKILPNAPYALTCDSTEAEIIKYTHNINAYAQVVMFNILYELTEKLGAHWDTVEEAIKADPLVSNRYASPVHKSGRGAGGNCFIKDFEAFSRFYKDRVKDAEGAAALVGLKKKNIDLLISSNKDIDLLKGVYGDDILGDEGK